MPKDKTIESVARQAYDDTAIHGYCGVQNENACFKAMASALKLHIDEVLEGMWKDVKNDRKLSDVGKWMWNQALEEAKRRLV